MGLEAAGFNHHLLLELDPDACQTLHRNRPCWPVQQGDLRSFSPPVNGPSHSLDLLSGGVPCPPFSVAGRQLGQADERDLFPAFLDLVERLQPRAVLVENVRGILQARFGSYRKQVLQRLASCGYRTDWRLLYSCDYGVPQLRPRAILVALRPEAFPRFAWPTAITCKDSAPTVGQVLYESMAARGWDLAEAWAKTADRIAPTICGGSRKHGGPDLGPSRARASWAKMGVNGSAVADDAPLPGASVPVRLTLPQLALLQGFPTDWRFAGSKTSCYRQIGNAFPPPVAVAVGRAVATALSPSCCLLDSGTELSA
ncbi:DNA cytosine methyltransferase [Streptomyces orinoci]|uniref:Cytosine-specific methyltransferase n=1 Tax=Streptomyces orinoci TaxID=67339 RepID=A0ABV3K8T3_STRON|nr:DNA (cytosine-5-)-methyltransferase [Streptomyces orinoci]